MALAEIRLERFSTLLFLPNTVQEEQMLLVAAAIYGVEDHRLHLLAEALALPPRYHWLQLLEVSPHTTERLVWLLPYATKHTLPLPILILAGLIHED